MRHMRKFCNFRLPSRNLRVKLVANRPSVVHKYLCTRDRAEFVAKGSFPEAKRFRDWTRFRQRKRKRPTLLRRAPLTQPKEVIVYRNALTFST